MGRAHRIASPRKRQDDPPGPLIAQIHHYQTKDHIMKVAREARSPTFHSSKIHVSQLQHRGLQEESHLHGEVPVVGCRLPIQDAFCSETSSHIWELKKIKETCIWITLPAAFGSCKSLLTCHLDFNLVFICNIKKEVFITAQFLKFSFEGIKVK